MKVIAYYSRDPNKRGPCYLSARNKLDYVIGSFIANGERVTVLSLCDRAYSAKTLKSEKETVSDGFEVVYPKCVSKKNRVAYFLRKVFSLRSILAFLNKNVEMNETVYVYHSVKSLPILRYLKEKKHADIILEVEEIYGDVTKNEELKRQELEAFAIADAYVFTSELLEEKINAKRKPSAVVYGTYRVEADVPEKKTFESEPEETVHCVYAGTFDSRKGGAAAAVAAAEYLPQNYHVHIIGFGNEKDKQELLSRIGDVQKRSAARVSFDGTLSGKEYVAFLQSCDIGLSTQNPEGAFNDTSFPSKILSYLSNGLRVVTVRIPAVEKSKIGSLVRYYDRQEPKEIAAAIAGTDCSVPFDGRVAVGELDAEFRKALRTILALLDL